jgi:hypothetical protein
MIDATMSNYWNELWIEWNYVIQNRTGEGDVVRDAWIGESGHYWVLQRNNV